MEEFIISETTKIFSKAIKRFGKNDKVDPQDVSILMCLEEQGDDTNLVFKICHNYQVVKETTMMGILGVLIDLKGYSLLVPPQIKKILENFQQELNSKKVEVCVYLHREEDDEVIYFLFNEGQLVKQFLLQDVLKLEMA